MGCQFSAPGPFTAVPPRPGISIEMHRRSRRSENSQTRCWTLMKQLMKQLKLSRRRLIQIDILPDDVLLEIFDFYMGLHYGGTPKRNTEAWQLLVHVCLRWRSLVFASPRRLNLQLYCTPATLARSRLDVWPALPLIISGNMTSPGMDNVIAALGQSNRARQVDLLGLDGRQMMERVLAAMQVPFPELTGLGLFSSGKTPRLIPDSFLDGSAPRLQYFELRGIPFLGLPRLHLSAPHLVLLHLFDIPHSGYISPKAIVDLLSVLSSLERFSLRFRSPQSSPDTESRRPPPQKRSVIPALAYLEFKGVTEYLEDLVTFIDTPQLGEMNIRFFNQIDFNTPRLAQFINRIFKLVKPGAHLGFYDNYVELQLESRFLEIRILCRESDWQLSSIEQVCNSLHLLSKVVDLYIEHPRFYELVWKDDLIEDSLWLQLLLPCTAVENLYLSKYVSQGIAAALKGIAGNRIPEALPSLQNIFAEGLEPSGRFQETIGEYIAARQLSGHPVTIFDWRRGL